MNDKIEMIIYEAVDQLNKLSKKQYHLKKGVNTALFGKDGKLDSLGFVNLLVKIEQNWKNILHRFSLRNVSIKLRYYLLFYLLDY